MMYNRIGAINHSIGYKIVHSSLNTYTEIDTNWCRIVNDMK